jgi:hypothetical protein
MCVPNILALLFRVVPLCDGTFGASTMVLESCARFTYTRFREDVGRVSTTDVYIIIAQHFV